MLQQNVCRSLEFGEKGAGDATGNHVHPHHDNFRRPKIGQIKQYIN